MATSHNEPNYETDQSYQHDPNYQHHYQYYAQDEELDEEVP